MQAHEQVFDPPPIVHEPLSWSREGLARQQEPELETPKEEPEPPPPAPERIELPPLAIFSNDTEKVLQSYFARGGQFTEPSNFSAMCERAVRLSSASFPCPACKSTGASPHTPEEYAARAVRIEEQRREAQARLLTADPKERDELAGQIAAARKALGDAMRAEAACKVCKGTGWTKPRKFGRGHGDAVSTHVWCPTCEGSCSTGAPDPWQLKRLVADLAEIPGLTLRQIVIAARDAGAQLSVEGRWTRAVEILRQMAWRAAGADVTVPLFYQREALRALVAVMRDSCSRCDGDGYVVPIDVRETGSTIPPATGSADVGDIMEHGEIDRILDVLRADMPLAAGVLEAYYGVDGNRWGATPRGRIWAVMPLTKDGATLAREAARAFEASHPGSYLDPCELLARELDADRSEALVNRRRRSQLDSGDKAARSLFEVAKRAWARAVIASGHDARDSARAISYETLELDAVERRTEAHLEAGFDVPIMPFLHETTAGALSGESKEWG